MLRDDLLKAGYCVSPNNIFSVRGVLMYAGSRMMKQPVTPMTDIQVTDDYIHVFTARFVPQTKTFVLETIRQFWDVPTFLSWIEATGEIMPDGLNVWD